MRNDELNQKTQNYSYKNTLEKTPIKSTRSIIRGKKLYECAMDQIERQFFFSK